MPKCGSQITLCDLPIRFDTYVGCSHNCKYCFVTRKVDIANISKGESVQALKNFINGKRTNDTKWCNWNIPIHWGGMSDPFQPCELDLKYSLEALKVFADTQYPVVVSTKGTTVLNRSEYLSLLAKCNVVVQISLVSPLFDKIETGAPTFAKRLEDIANISKYCKRLIIRIQPYICEALPSILENIPKYANAGVYGVTIEGIKYFQKRTGFIKCGGDFVYPVQRLKADFMQIKEVCHKNNLKFFSAENRLRLMGDNTCCCGIMDLEGFVGNKANLVHYLKKGKINYKESMLIKGQGTQCFKALAQDTIGVSAFKNSTFKDIMDCLAKDKKCIESLLP